MKVTMIKSLLLAVLSTSVLASAMPQQAQPGDIVEANPSTDPEEADRQQNMQQCACKNYQDSAFAQQGLAPCKPFCGDAVDTANGNISSVLCIGGSSSLTPQWQSDSTGLFTPGVCRCNVGLSDMLVNDVVLSLPAIAEIGCEIMVQSFELIVKVGASAVPGAGEVDAADAGTQALVKAANTIKKAGKTAKDMLSWLDPCGSSNFTQGVDAVFDDITGGVQGSGGSGNLAADASEGATTSTYAPAPAPTSTSPPPAPPTTTAAASQPTGAAGDAFAALAKILGGAFAGNPSAAASALGAAASSAPSPTPQRRAFALHV